MAVAQTPHPLGPPINRQKGSATIFATQLPNTGRDCRVSGGKRHSVSPNKINRFGMKANYTVQRSANCKTVYSGSIPDVASINIINALH
jgi:hypothetical protein